MATMKNPTSSFSPSIHGSTYDVFLSFRGEDVRWDFIGHLDKALSGKGISTFMDDRGIEKGEEITLALEKAIQHSRIALVIFSKSYASSVFCLEELAKIMECSKGKGMLVWPVFYEVEPSDVRYQNGSYGEALAKHEERSDKEKINKWRSALANAANTSGMHFKVGSRYQYELIENIIQEVSKKIPMPFDVGKYPVGLERRVQKVISYLDFESNDGVQVVGIYGIGGIGKTTLARAVYNSIAYKFRSPCFLDDIRENSMKHGLLQLRDKLLCELVGEEDFKHWKGRQEYTRIQIKLHRKKFLLILDDVDKLEQVNILLMLDDVDQLKQLCSGSIIIITTRFQHLLQKFGEERTYEVERLNRDEALELFSWSAFKTKAINPSYKDISQGIIEYCYGLPLSVKMMGLGFGIGILSKEQISPDSFDKAVSECNSALDTNERIPHENIQEISYICDRGKDNINYGVDEKKNAHHLRAILKEEQEENEHTEKEREATHLDTIICNSNKDKGYRNEDDKYNAQNLRARLKKEQEEKDKTGRERETTHSSYDSRRRFKKKQKQKENTRKEKETGYVDNIHDSSKDNINYSVDEKENARHLRAILKEEQEENEHTGKEREATHLDTIIRNSNKDKVYWNEDEKYNAQNLRARLKKEQEEKEKTERERETTHSNYDSPRVDLSHPGAELRSLKVFYHNIQKVVIYNIRLPKQSAVEDVTNYLKSKVNLSHPDAELRLLRVFHHKIPKIFSPNEKIENINDQFGTLRAEEIPEEEKHLGRHDQLIHVYHFMKVTVQNREQIQNFGDPFFFVIHMHERLADIKLRIRKMLRVSDKEFSKWMFAVVIFDCPEYLKDSDIVSTRFKGRDIYGAWKYCYLGLEHADNAP